jgi:hypothetical protein
MEASGRPRKKPMKKAPVKKESGLIGFPGKNPKTRGQLNQAAFVLRRGKSNLCPAVVKEILEFF